MVNGSFLVKDNISVEMKYDMVLLQGKCNNMINNYKLDLPEPKYALELVVHLKGSASKYTETRMVMGEITPTELSMNMKLAAINFPRKV